MVTAELLVQTKDDQEAPSWGVPRRPVPRRKLSQLEKLRLAIVAHMREQRHALDRWIAQQREDANMLPQSIPDWNYFKLGALKMTERMTPIISAMWDQSGSRFATQVGLDPDEWSVTNPHTAHKIQSAALAFCQETNNSTSDDLTTALEKLRTELHEGIVTQGESLDQLTKRVQKIFDTGTKSRARTIAQTEASRARHAAQNDAAIQSGVVTGWRWKLSSDACPTCVAIAARNPVVRLGSPFAIIGKNPHYATILMPPAHPRCNCTAQEILDTDSQPAFDGQTLVDPHPGTREEIDTINAAQREHDEAILRGSEAWGAAPYAERYPGKVKPAPEKKPPPTKLPKKPRRQPAPLTPEEVLPGQYGEVGPGEEAIPPLAAAPQKPTRPFVDLVRDAIESVPAERLWGNDAAFIHHVWEEYQKIPGAERLTLADFKERVVHSELRGIMHRADMVGVMNPEDVRQSHTEVVMGGYVAATFNFLRRAKPAI